MGTKRVRKGTALITAIMLCAIFAAAIVGVGSYGIRQMNISKVYGNGVEAYYAAESGIEEGLLRFRFNKNAQVPDSVHAYLDPLRRIPDGTYRNFLLKNPTRDPSEPSSGSLSGYSGNDMQPVYDLQVYYKQKFAGQDINNDGLLNDADLQDPNYGSDQKYKIIKDDIKSFTIPSDTGYLSLYWKFLTPCNSGRRAVEVKLRVSPADPASGKDTYTALFADTTCPTTILNSDPATMIANVFYVPDLKGRMNITSKTAVELTLHPVDVTPADEAGIAFGYTQYFGNAPVAGPTTTIRSIGYYRGTTREITAEINRQSGTILDIFNYVLFKKAPWLTPDPASWVCPNPWDC